MAEYEDREAMADEATLIIEQADDAQVSEEEFGSRPQELAEGEALDAEIEQFMRGNTGAIAGYIGEESLPVSGDREGEEDSPFEEMSDDDVMSQLNMELSQSIGSNQDELQGQRAEAFDYYYGRPRGDEMPGRSSIQSLDVADMVEAMLSQILPAFVQNMSAEFGADNPQDEISAQQESEYINYLIQQVNNGFTTFYKLFKDALLLRNCVAKICIDDKQNVTEEEYDGIDGMSIAQLMMPKNAQDEEVTLEAAEPSQQRPNTFDIIIRRKWMQKRLDITPAPIEDIRVNGDHDDISLENARMVAQESTVTESYLIEQGFDPIVVMDLPTSSDSNNVVNDARSRLGTEWENSGVKSNRPIRIMECWYLVDQDGDGISERHKITASSDGDQVTTMLGNEVVNYSIFASGAPFIQNGKWLGISLFDKLKEVQDQKTGFLRNIMDNAYLANNIRLGYVVGRANADDVMNSKPGGTIRLRDPNALVPVAHNDILQYSLALLAYLDKIRTERAGSSLDTSNENVPVETAHGAERVVSAKEQLASMVAQTLSQTVVRDVYLITHRLVKEYMAGPQNYKVGNDWRTVDPSTWPTRDRVGINIGMSQGERIQQSGALQQTVGMQKELMEKGQNNIMVSNAGMYRSLVDLGRMSGLNSPEKYWVDPSSPESQQAAQQAAQQAQQQQQQAQQQVQQQAQIMLKLQEMQEETKRLKATMDQQLGYAQLGEKSKTDMNSFATDMTKLELEHDKDVPGSAV